MHDAFECVAILERLPLEIDCIASSDKTLLVGTNKGHLLVYDIHEDDETSNHGVKKFEVELQRSNKAFGRKPIMQLVVVEEFNIIVSLSDGCVNVHDFNTYNQKQSFPRSKGVTFFSIDKSSLKSKQYPVRLCAISKRKIQNFYWNKDRGFVELYGELGLPETPKIAAWIGDYICFAMRKEYALLKADTGLFRCLGLCDGKFCIFIINLP